MYTLTNQSDLLERTNKRNRTEEPIMAQRDEVELTILQSNMSVFNDEHKEATDEFETSPKALVEQIARMRPAEFRMPSAK